MNATPSARRQRPAWLATALTFLSGGLYWLWWFGATWAELKRERGDAPMRPVWHALTQTLPVYASFRTHAHFRTLADVVRAKLPQIPDRAAWATWLVSISWVTGVATFFVKEILLLVVAAATAALYAIVVYQGQSDFNAYLRASGGEPRERAHAFETIALVLSVLFAIWYVYDIFNG